MSSDLPMTPDEARRLAVLEASYHAHERHCAERWQDLRRTIEGNQARREEQHEANVARLNAIENAISNARGGWKALAAAGTVGGSIVAVVVKLLPAIK